MLFGFQKIIWSILVVVGLGEQATNAIELQTVPHGGKNRLLLQSTIARNDAATLVIDELNLAILLH